MNFSEVDHGEQAAALFLRGYNCAQSVAVAFCDVTGLEPELAARMASSFGGGMGRMRETCGAVTGMMMVLGLVYGYDRPGDDAGKKELYTLVQQMAGEFREQAGSITCRALLHDPPSDPNPTPRTAEFYKTRPCARLIRLAGQLLDQYMTDHPV